MNMKKVYLKRNKEESLLRYHPWVFSGAIHHTDEGVTEGDTVLVVTSEDYPIAVGHYQHGTIAVRVLSTSGSFFSRWPMRTAEKMSPVP